MQKHGVNARDVLTDEQRAVIDSVCGACTSPFSDREYELILNSIDNNLADYGDSPELEALFEKVGALCGRRDQK